MSAGDGQDIADNGEICVRPFNHAAGVGAEQV